MNDIDCVYHVARAIHEHLCRRGIMTYLDNDEDCEGLARAAIAAMAEATDWQPIESAPQSGEILLYAAETGEQFVAFWGAEPEGGDQQWVFARGNGISFIVRDPTHWQPLPEPPAKDPTT